MNQSVKNLSVVIIAFLFLFALVQPALSQSFSDGTLIRAEGEEKVYVIHNQKKRWIRTAEVFNSYHFNWQEIQVLPPEKVNSIKINNLIRPEDDIKVYALNDAGYKRHLRSPNIFESYNLSWKDVATINQTEFDNYKKSNLIRLSEKEEIYFLENETKRWVRTIGAFEDRGFKWEAVHIVSKADFDSYDTGGDIVSEEAEETPEDTAEDTTSEEEPAVETISLNASVASDSPNSQNIAAGSSGRTGVTLSKIKFEAGKENIRINSLRFTHEGDNKNSFSAIHLYDGDTQMAGPETLSSVGGTITFDISGQNFDITKNSAKILSVKVDYNGITAGGADSGDRAKLYIANPGDDITAESLESGKAIAISAAAPSVAEPASFGNLTLYRSVPEIALNAFSPSGSSSGGTNATVFRFDIKAHLTEDIILNTVALTIDGTTNLLGSKDAKIFRSSNTDTSLAKETYKKVVLQKEGTTSKALASEDDFNGIPVGATIRIFDDSADNYFPDRFKVTGVKNTGSELTFTPSLSENIATGDIVYYRPLQPGPGKLYFGAMTHLSSDYDKEKDVKVVSANGFAAGDAVKISGFSANCNLISVSANVLEAANESPANKTVILSAAPNISSAIVYNQDCSLSAGNIAAAINKATGNAVIFVSSNDGNIEETINKGTTKKFTIKGDTLGTESGTALQFSITKEDLLWDDTIRHFVNSATKGLPLEGGELTY